MHNRLVAMLVALVVVAGCGKNDHTDSATGAQASARAPAAIAADDVAAVLQSAGAPLAKLGFVVLTKPVVGVQSAMRLDISALDPVPTMQVSVEGEGIAIDATSAKVDFALAAAGATASHELKFVPQRDGLAEVTVRLRADAASPETIYVIPVLVEKAAASE